MLKLGVPSKGRLMEKTFDWFGARGVTLRKSGSDREYAGAVDGIDGVELVLLSANINTGTINNNNTPRLDPVSFQVAWGRIERPFVYFPS